MTPDRQHMVLNDPAVNRFVFVRNPIERAVSGFFSKLACGSGDSNDHAKAMRALEKGAPKAVRRAGATPLPSVPPPPSPSAPARV